MAKYRPIKVQTWNDPHFIEYSIKGKLVFLYLCTNSATSESGIYPLSVKTVSDATSVRQKDALSIIEKDLKDKVLYDKINKVVFVKNFLRHNYKGNPELLQKSLYNDFKNTTTSLWKDFAKCYPSHYEYLERVSQVKAKTSNDLDIDNDNELNNEEGAGKPPPPPSLIPGSVGILVYAYGVHVSKSEHPIKTRSVFEDNINRTEEPLKASEIEQAIMSGKYKGLSSKELCWKVREDKKKPAPIPTHKGYECNECKDMRRLKTGKFKKVDLGKMGGVKEIPETIPCPKCNKEAKA